MTLEQLIIKMMKKIMNESVEFGEFKNDPVTWRAANLIYDNAHTGVTLGRLFGYLKDESGGQFNGRKFLQTIEKLKSTGDYVLNGSGQWHTKKIWHKAFKRST